MEKQFEDKTKDEIVALIKQQPDKLLDLIGADLSGADLSYADLSNANLSYADLSGADLSYADLSNANLSGAKGTFKIQFGVKLQVVQQ